MKLPKQWRHWCEVEHLRPMAGGRSHYDWFYLKGHGRVWRVNDKGAFQCGDKLADFDRWALCSIEQYERLPRNMLEFSAAVFGLLRAHSAQHQTKTKGA